MNGHMLNEQGRWVRVPSAADLIQQETCNRTKNQQVTAWLLWLFLGGIGANLAYVYRKQAPLILAASILLFLVTFGLAAFGGPSTKPAQSDPSWPFIAERRLRHTCITSDSFWAGDPR